MFLSNPVSQRLFADPGQFGQIIQTHHAARALQGVNTPAGAHQGLKVAGRFVELEDLVLQLRDDQPRLTEKDSEQLGISPRCTELNRLLLDHSQRLRSSGRPECRAEMTGGVLKFEACGH